MYQQLTLVGNLGGDPEMRYTPSGKAVASFNLAVSKHWTVDGEKREKTIWFRISAWEKLAELAAQYLAKGRQVMVIGEIENPNVYTNKAGEPAASLEVTAREIKFLGSKPQDENGAAPAPKQQAPAKKALAESDIPF